jgi:DNA-binding NarL/FixJ family response regulator
MHAMSLRVLIIDDSAQFRRAARVILEQGGATVVDSVPTGAEGDRSALEHRPDVILVDVGLAGESGFDVAERLCRDPGRRWQVVLVSARPGEDYADLLAGSPAAGYLPKTDLSAAAITALLERRDPA